MDEDDKEMIQEAWARLANTRGKKANWKAWEKKLEEFRRQANLLKDWELKAAGIDYVAVIRRRKVERDYNIEVPFQREE